MNEEFSRERFAGALGSKFTLHAAEEKSVEIELIEVSEPRERPNQVSFSIVFLLPKLPKPGSTLCTADWKMCGGNVAKNDR